MDEHVERYEERAIERIMRAIITSTTDGTLLTEWKRSTISQELKP